MQSYNSYGIINNTVYVRRTLSYHVVYKALYNNKRLILRYVESLTLGYIFVSKYEFCLLICKLFDRVLQLTKGKKCYMQFTEFHLNLIIENCSKSFGNIRILIDSLTVSYKIYYSE